MVFLSPCVEDFIPSSTYSVAKVRCVCQGEVVSVSVMHILFLGRVYNYGMECVACYPWQLGYSSVRNNLS